MYWFLSQSFSSHTCVHTNSLCSLTYGQRCWLCSEVIIRSPAHRADNSIECCRGKKIHHTPQGWEGMHTACRTSRGPGPVWPGTAQTSQLLPFSMGSLVPSMQTFQRRYSGFNLLSSHFEFSQQMQKAQQRGPAFCLWSRKVHRKYFPLVKCIGKKTAKEPLRNRKVQFDMLLWKALSICRYLQKAWPENRSTLRSSR